MRTYTKNRIIYTALLLLCIIGFWTFENFYTPATYSRSEDSGSKIQVPDFFLPTSTTGELVFHEHFALSYHETFEQAEWIAYTLEPKHLTYDDRERPYFIEDPKVKSKSADWRNFRGSGYDRGHLCPAGDRRFSEQAYNETFYTSNISPQNANFNAGIWNELELKIRQWCKQYGTLYISTGGILEKGLPTIGEEEVAVPKAYFKIVARGDEKKLKVLAFLIPHQDTRASLQEFLVTVDTLEELTGINFFNNLTDSLENEIEKQLLHDGWKF